MSGINSIPGAKQSPRIINGIIKWYAGDTFELCIELELTDQDGSRAALGAGDTIEAVFRNQRRETVKTFSFADIQNSTVTLNFDSACTALFPRGEYSYDVFLSGTRRVTLARGNVCIVE